MGEIGGFMEGIDLGKMSYDEAVFYNKISSLTVPQNSRSIGECGLQYAVYDEGGKKIEVQIENN